MADNQGSYTYNMGDYNRGGYIAFMFSMVFTMAFFIYIAFIHPGVDLKEVEAQIKKEAVKDATTAQPADAAAPEKPAEEPNK